MLLLNALSDKSRWRPISVVLCADNVGEDEVRLAGRARLANTVIFSSSSIIIVTLANTEGPIRGEGKIAYCILNADCVAS